MIARGAQFLSWEHEVVPVQRQIVGTADLHLAFQHRIDDLPWVGTGDLEFVRKLYQDRFADDRVWGHLGRMILGPRNHRKGSKPNLASLLNLLPFLKVEEPRVGAKL